MTILKVADETRRDSILQKVFEILQNGMCHELTSLKITDPRYAQLNPSATYVMSSQSLNTVFFFVDVEW